MDGKNILDLPDDILFVVLLFVAYVPRDILTCYQVCKAWRFFLDGVDGIFWRRAFMAAYEPLTYGWSSFSEEFFFWKKGTYTDPLKSLRASREGRGPRFVEPILLPLSSGCLPPYYLSNESNMGGATTLYDCLKLGLTAVHEWKSLFKDMSMLFHAGRINRAFIGGNLTIFLQDFNQRFWTLSALPGPFPWLRCVPSPVSVDLVRLHINDILKSVPIPEVLVSQYEVMPVCNKRDFSYCMFHVISNRFGIGRTDNSERPFKTVLDPITGSELDSAEDASDAAEDVSDAAEDVSDAAEDVSDAAEDVSDAAEDVSDADNETESEFAVQPGGKEDKFAMHIISDLPGTDLGDVEYWFSELYSLFVERLGSCFFIRPRADCEYETFLVHSLPTLFVSARPDSGRFVGLYSCYGNVKLN
jgi:hypothetical protein